MNFSKLDEFLSKMPERGFPACELAFSQNGEILYHNAFGFADSKKTRPARRGDLYWIYSTSKLLSCIAAMRLVEEGRLCLDDPVSKYIPEYANVMVKDKDGTLRPPKEPMKIWHLFTMTGGLTYDIQTPNVMAATSLQSSTLDIVKALTLDPLVFDPGSDYLYSLCHDVLGGVCEVITGMKFSEYMDAVMFKPLGLSDIGFRPTDAQKQRFSAMYKYDRGTHTATEIPCVNELNQLVNVDSAGGGIFSSVEDYLKIITVIACGGTTPDGYCLLKPETIKMMQADLLCDKARASMLKNEYHHGYGWGLGCLVHTDPVLSLSTAPIGVFGWNGAAGAYTFVDTENKLALFYATHVRGAGYGYNKLHPKIKELVYELIL